MDAELAELQERFDAQAVASLEVIEKLTAAEAALARVRAWRDEHSDRLTGAAYMALTAALDGA